MWKHLVLGVVIALIVSVCGSAEARLLGGRRGGCPGGKCGVTDSGMTVSALEATATSQLAAGR